MKTRAEALQDLADYLAEVAETVYRLTPRESAERVWRPGGPSVEELTTQIEAARAA